MKNVFKLRKRGIAAILTLCILLCTTGIGVHAISVPEENAATTAEATTVVVEETTISTKELTEVTEENAQELMPMMATACWGTLDEALDYYIGEDNWSYNTNGAPCAEGFDIYVSNGYCHVTGDDVSYSFRFG